MREDADFERQVQVVQKKANELRRRTAGDRKELETVSPETVEELQSTLEALRVAEEELRQQNEELAAARQAVEAERQRYQELFEFAPDGYLVTDPHGAIQEANRAAARLLAAQRDFLVGKPLIVFVAKVERRAFRSQLARLAEQGRVEDWEIHLRPWEGEPFPAALTVAAAYDAQGELLGLRWSIRDFAEREHLLAQIQVQAQRMRHLVEAVPTGLLLLDVDRRVLLSNPTARQVLKALNGAGEADDDLLAHLGPYPLADVLRRHAQPLPIEITLAGPDPRSSAPAARTFEVQARPIGAEAARQWVLALREVTREREIQQQLQARERLATVGQLAAGVAHDFNNILASIVLYAGMLLQSSDLSPRDRERLQTIHQQGHRAANLVQQILDFARRSIMERKPLDLIPLLKELQKLLARTLPESIQLQLRYDHDDYVVNADPTRLQQVVMNLALNARDAMPEGGQLGFQLSRFWLDPDQRPPLHDMAPGEWVCLAVADTGAGITPDVLPHIFEPFFTTKEVGQGSGLGLAQVYGIVQQHEGHVGVESQVGHGTTFTLYLPAQRLPQAVPSPADRPALAGGQGEMILVVEDDATTREAICDILEELGYRVRLATHGQQALARYDSEIALVISDLVMPEMGGLELYNRLQARRASVKVILTTGYPPLDEGQALLAQGIAAWIKKPFAAEELAQTVQRVLE